MLVVTRKLGEKVYIGGDVCITVVDIDRGNIRLGIDAPRNVPVFRAGLLSRNQPDAVGRCEHCGTGPDCIVCGRGRGAITPASEMPVEPVQASGECGG
jgi:carbon storage regulator